MVIFTTNYIYVQGCFKDRPKVCPKSTFQKTVAFTLRSQIEGYTRLLIFRKFSTLPAVIWAYSFLDIQENFQPLCFFTFTNDFFPPYSLLLEPIHWLNLKKIPAYPFIIRASPCIEGPPALLSLGNIRGFLVWDHSSNTSSKRWVGGPKKVKNMMT